ncbi:hypothetical protein LCGC14_0262440 [marine sediment metagenome]|uniref:HTH cro/C1-type domain-containing protein n=1 Tax=marine sediment metagenome TaxID=412755 RepID=A0A0F9U160_9ZZZZ
MTNGSDLGKILRQHRAALDLTLHQLSLMSGVSASHLARIERGDRFPSAHMLQKIAPHLGFSETELFSLAGYLSPSSSPVPVTERLDPYVASVLSQEPVEMQRRVIAILSMLKSLDQESGGNIVFRAQEGKGEPGGRR